MEKVLSTLKLDQYYKVILAISAFTLFLSLKFSLMVSNDLVAMVSIGSLLIGLGEWRNSVPETTITSQYRITVRNRKNTILGNGLNIMGIVIIGAGVYIG
ncbi:membrane hypothetical protein [Vibrio coralliirubri]|uniref:hypothetical protein n=1 Tax=Vibrio coralliirubri TaxID=1516159 RepID=UPI0006304105|nr:hypothetical protein [Vibrio coralliirubri]CDT79446.1 membrane hypothetical protein [Vibrio coralliirubri]